MLKKKEFMFKVSCRRYYWILARANTIKSLLRRIMVGGMDG